MLSTRACSACTLLCQDLARTTCELCGSQLPVLSSQSPCIEVLDDVGTDDDPGGRPCPACTFICTDSSRTVCEICNSSLSGTSTDRVATAGPPEKKQRNSSDPPAQQRTVFSFFKSSGSEKPAQIPSAKSEGQKSDSLARQSVSETSLPDRLDATSEVLSASPQRAEPEVAPQLVTSAVFSDVAQLTLPLEDYEPSKACWRAAGAAVPYRHVAATLDALEATRSRLSKDTILTNAFRSMLALRASAAEVEAACYLFAPAKDAQTGGHRLRPDWAENGRPLSIPHGSITSAVLEATGASRTEFRQRYTELHEIGEVALALRERGGRQRLLCTPLPLTAAGVRTSLLSLADISGTGAEKRKTQCLVKLLRAATGTELKWLVRTFLPHMAAGISLEASVLPALGAASVVHDHGQLRMPPASALKEAEETVRTGFALRPDVGVLVQSLIDGGIDGVSKFCTLHVGVPMQPMLAKACSSVDELVKRISRAMPNADTAVRVTAEHKYDGQRAQIHRTAADEIRIYSRKIDDMTYKYPDVVAAIRRTAKGRRALILDAEIVAVMPSASADKAGNAESSTPASGTGDGGKEAEIAAFQSLSTRKRKNVTEANAATTSVAVKLFLFDLLLLGDEVLLHKPFGERRALMREEFAEEKDILAFAAATDIDLAHCQADAKGSAGKDTVPFSSDDAASSKSPIAAESDAGDPSGRRQLEDALRRAIAASCEGLMVKRLDSLYEPSTKRSDCWLKLKKDYLDNLGDSFDLVPIGGWRGSGRKSKWVSPWLVATYDPQEGTFGSVCRVMSGFTDQFYRENTIRYLGAEIIVKKHADGDMQNVIGDSNLADDAECGSDAEADASDADSAAEVGDADNAGDLESAGEVDAGRACPALLLSSPAAGVETRESPQYWFQPSEVWEIRGADVTISPKHMSARGMVDADRGLSLRFPRFIRKRADKRIADATTPEQLAAAFRKQTQQR